MDRAALVAIASVAIGKALDSSSLNGMGHWGGDVLLGERGVMTDDLIT
jgi:hypothetical protein